MVNGESDRVFDSSYFDIHLWKLTWNPKIGGLVQMIFLFRPGDDFQVPAVNFPGCSWLIVNLITMCIFFWDGTSQHLHPVWDLLIGNSWRAHQYTTCSYGEKRCSYWQFCWWPFWVVENVTLFNGCWWPPTFGDEKVTLNHLEEGMDLGWDILHPERLANVAYHLLCGPCCYWLSSCVWVLWLWASWTQKNGSQNGHRLETQRLERVMTCTIHQFHLDPLCMKTMCCLFLPLEICLSSSRFRLHSWMIFEGIFVHLQPSNRFYSQKLLKDPGRKSDANRRLLLLESLNSLGELCVFPIV